MTQQVAWLALLFLFVEFPLTIFLIAAVTTIALGKREKKPCIGSKRTVEKFLWFPLCINGECRWFRKVKFEQAYKKCVAGTLDGMVCYNAVDWVNTAWIYD